MQKKTYTVEEAKRALEKYCVYQDRCHKEIEKKLYDFGMIDAAKEVIILHLMEHDFLNEERFCKSFARGKFNHKKWGKNRIVRELKLRDISDYNIKTALKEISEEDYQHTLHELATKRKESVNESNTYKLKKKIADYLLYRGWESNLVYDKINEIVK